jgi:hypothetical protein
MTKFLQCSVGLRKSTLVTMLLCVATIGIALSACGSDGTSSATIASSSTLVQSKTATKSATPSSPTGIEADVYVGGTIIAVSTQELDVRGMESNVPIIQIKLEDTEDAFFRQSTRPLLALSLTEAAPRVGEDVCVLARLHSNGDLVAWLIFLESQCQHNP